MKSIVEGSLWDSERGRGRVGERDPLGSCMIWNCSSTMSQRTVSGVSQALFESAWPEEFPHHSQCSGSCNTMSGQRLGPASLEKKVKGRARKKARAKRASSHSWAKPGVYPDFPDSQIWFPVALALSSLKQGFGYWNWGWVRAVRAPNPHHLASGQWQGPGSLALQKRVPTRWKVVKEVFIRKRFQSVWIDTWAGSERERGAELHTCGVWITFMVHFFQVSFDQSFGLAWFWVCIWHISGSSHVCVHVS